MKISHPIFRAGFSILAGCVLVLPLVSRYLNNSAYTQIDRAFLLVIPILASACLFYEILSAASKWIGQIRISTRAFFSLLAIPFLWILSSARLLSPAVLLSALTFILLLYLVFLSKESSGETTRFPYYLTAFFPALALGYMMTGFLDEPLGSPFVILLFAIISVLTTNILGYEILRHAAQDEFFKKPLNLILLLALPVFLAVLTIISAQLPSMFIWEYITIPSQLSIFYFIGALIAGAWGTHLLRAAAIQQIRQTKTYAFFMENLPGIYTGGMFFLIHLVLARALNHPMLGYNSVLFETDAGPWMTILASPEGDAINRAVHPLVLILSRPIIRLLAVFMGGYWNLAALLVAAFLSGSCVFMAYLFVKRAVKSETYALLFAMMLGFTSAHLLFGSLTENYVFGMTSLIFFFLLIQAGETRLARLVPIGVVVFGITVTNIAQTAIGLFFNKLGFWKVTRYCFLVLAAGVTLTVITNAIYPNTQTFFFVPADLAFEGNFIKPSYESPLASAKEKALVVTRTMFLYQISAPEPLIVISQKKNDPFPTLDLKTFDWREHKLASYKGLGNFPLALWLLLLGGASFLSIKNSRSSPHLPLMLGLLGSLGFNFLMHLFYGTELFLYTPYWAYALVFFIALAYAELAGKKWFESMLAFFVIVLMVNNGWFIFVIMRALAPFFATS